MLELLVVCPDEQKSIHSFEDDVVTIGRKTGNVLVLADTAVSSRHARIYVEQDRVWVEDLGSTNGTYVNGRRISSPTPITCDDIVGISKFRVILYQIYDPTQPGHAAIEDVDQDEGIGPASAGGEGGEGSPLVFTSSSQYAELQIDDDESGPATAEMGAPVRPFVPRSLEDTGLRKGVLIDLILKAIYFAGEISGYALADELCLPFQNVIEPLLTELRRDKLIDVKGGGESFGAVSMIFSMTAKATEVVLQVLDRNRYSGPAPISMEAYAALVESQSIRRCRIPRDRVREEFSHLVIGDEVCDGIGPALNSGTAILLYGPPGNGKTVIAQAMSRCFDDFILIPYAIDADGAIIKVFDEHNHIPVALPDEMSQDTDFDRRFILCRRPMIMVGGELTLDMLDMSYSREARYYEAPFQMKANGGVLLVDDFGRQKVSPRDLLNRWIVPLESNVDFISLATGKKLQVPFDVFVAFATNLDPADLVDDAFLRRVRYKLEVPRPDPAQYREIFERECQAKHIAWSDEGFEYLLSLYAADGRPMNACEPRNLVDGIRSHAAYLEQEPSLSPGLIRPAYRSYFTAFQK